MIEAVCVVCGRRFAAERSTAQYCSNACKMRKRNHKEYVPVYSAPPEPPEAPPADVQAAVVAAHRVANDMGRLSERAPWQLRAACGRISAAIQAALDAEGF